MEKRRLLKVAEHNNLSPINSCMRYDAGSKLQFSVPTKYSVGFTAESVQQGPYILKVEMTGRVHVFKPWGGLLAACCSVEIKSKNARDFFYFKK